MRRQAWGALSAAAAIAVVAMLAGRQEAQVAPAFSDSFSRPDGLITNEWEYAHPTSPSAVASPDWQMTSGSLFAAANAGWTGLPDRTAPNADSSNGNDSAVFRLITRRADFYEAEVSFSLLNQGLTAWPTSPATAWDGVHVQLRYVSQFNLYAVSVNRRDGTVIIKKKVPGGPSNDGTYYNIGAYRAFPVPYGLWQAVRITIRDNPDGSVALQLFIDGVPAASALDDGTLGGPPIRQAGRIGVRGDNCDFKFDDFTVTPLGAGPPSGDPAPGGPSAPSVPTADVRARERFLSPGLRDGVNDIAVFGPDADEVMIFDLRGRRVFRQVRQGAARLSWDGRDELGRPLESGLYIARVKHDGGSPVYQSFALAK